MWKCLRPLRLAVLAGLAALALSALAQSYPNRPIKWVVAYPPAGARIFWRAHWVRRWASRWGNLLSSTTDRVAQA